MDLHKRLLLEREIAPVPMPGEEPRLMELSKEIMEGTRAMPEFPIPSTIRKTILAGMRAEHCQ